MALHWSLQILEVAQNSAYHGQLKLHQRLRSRPAATSIQSAEADFANVAAISNRLTTIGLSNYKFLRLFNILE